MKFVLAVLLCSMPLCADTVRPALGPFVAGHVLVESEYVETPNRPIGIAVKVTTQDPDTDAFRITIRYRSARIGGVVTRTVLVVRDKSVSYPAPESSPTRTLFRVGDAELVKVSVEEVIFMTTTAYEFPTP